jgi:type IV pilus assembly protein PilC
MPTYQYEAMDNTGTEIKESIEAESEAEAQQLIRDKGFFVTNITEQQKKKRKKAADKKQVGPKKKKSLSFGKVRPKELCTFTRQLSTLQDAGLPVLRSLKILGGQAKPGPLKSALDGVVEDIESGNTLSESMAKQPKAFDELYVNMVRAGEASGALEIILQRLADFKERSQTLKKKVQGAMIYPVAVVCVAGGIVGFIMYYIVPKFRVIFEGFGTDLPKITEMLIAASNIVVNYFYLFPAVPIGFWLFIKVVKKNKTGEYIVDFCALRIPVLGKILKKSTTARIMRTLGTLISSGVPILEALTIARDTAGNAVFKRAFDNIYAAIREGETIAKPLGEANIADDLVVNMVDVGEETGALDVMMYKVADMYDEDVNTLVDGMVKLIEPMLVVVLGLVVGFIVIALFMPLIKLLNDLS